MTISATTVRFDDATMWVELADGRTLGVPLAWFPRLLDASPTDREKVEIGGPALLASGSAFRCQAREFSESFVAGERGEGFVIGHARTVLQRDR
jgi:hypothetical protein